MKKTIKIVVGLVTSLMLIFTFVGCGPKTSPEEEAAATVDTMLSGLKDADMESINALAGGENVFGDVESTFGSAETADSVLKAMFGHFDYEIGTPEISDEIYANVPVTVTNVDMQKVVDTWMSDAMAYAAENPDIANDKKALQAKLFELFGEAVEKVAGEEGGTVTNEVVFPMYLEDGKWNVSKSLGDDVLDKLLGGMMTAIQGLSGGQ